TWHSLLFALPLAMLAYTGLETVANMAEEARSPGEDIPRSVFSAVALVVLVYTAIAYVGLSAFPVEHGASQLGNRWLKAPLVGVNAAAGHPVIFLASLFSFGVLLAFVAAQVAVLRLRVRAPDLARPYRVPLDVHLRGAVLPLPTMVGLVATGAVFVIAMV